MEKMLTYGSRFLIQNYDTELRKQDIDKAIKYSNNKSAQNNMGTLLSHVKKEITKGWIVPLLPEHAKQINNAMILPMGVVS